MLKMMARCRYLADARSRPWFLQLRFTTELFIAVYVGVFGTILACVVRARVTQVRVRGRQRDWS
jgi:hypothetical protein